MSTNQDLPVSKRIKLIEAVTFMLGTFGKLRDQGVSPADFPEELTQVFDTLQMIHAAMASDLPANGREHLARESVKIPVSDNRAARQIETKLFQLGFGYLLKGEIRQLPVAFDDLIGFRINRRGHMTAFLKGQDDIYFENDLSRVVQPEKVLKAKTYADI
jgi:hypothetical protein